MSHGGLASAMLKSAQMIAGDAANFYTVDMMPDDGIEGTKKKLDNVLNKIKPTEKVLLLTDLYGGTPCNVAVLEASKNKNIEVVSGLNLPMVIECALSKANDGLAKHLSEIGKQSIKLVDTHVVLNSEDE